MQKISPPSNERLRGDFFLTRKHSKLTRRSIRNSRKSHTSFFLGVYFCVGNITQEKKNGNAEKTTYLNRDIFLTGKMIKPCTVYTHRRRHDNGLYSELSLLTQENHIYGKYSGLSRCEYLLTLCKVALSLSHLPRKNL